MRRIDTKQFALELRAVIRLMEQGPAILNNLHSFRNHGRSGESGKEHPGYP